LGLPDPLINTFVTVCDGSSTDINGQPSLQYADYHEHVKRTYKIVPVMLTIKQVKNLKVIKLI